MSILALDTSSRRRALCVLADDDGSVLDGRPPTGTHLDRELPPAVAALLRPDLHAVACVLGPGSFTGLRVGIAAALGVAHARDLPLHGVAALDVVARAAPADTAAVEAVADAGRGALYVAAYARDADGLHLTTAPRRVDAAEWRPSPDAVAVSLDALPGTVDASARAAEALAAAAVAALRTSPLPRTGLEPVYLHGDVSARGRPRV